MLKGGEDYLSVDWLEFTGETERDAQIETARTALRRRGFELRPSARLAVLNVGEMVDYVRQEAPDHRLLTVSHQPRRADDPHSGIFDTNHTDAELLIAALIAERVSQVYHAQPQADENAG